MAIEENFLDFTCDCNIVIDSPLISRDDVIQSLCEEYVKYIFYSKLSKDTPININMNYAPINSKVKINSASVDELKKLPGISLVHAKKIIQYREHNNYINSWDDLRLLGVNQDIIDNLKDLIIIDKVNSRRSVTGGRILDL